MVAVLVPGLAVAAFYLVVDRRPFADGLLYGLAFGLVYAALTFVWNRE